MRALLWILAVVVVICSDQACGDQDGSLRSLRDLVASVRRRRGAETDVSVVPERASVPENEPPGAPVATIVVPQNRQISNCRIHKRTGDNIPFDVDGLEVVTTDRLDYEDTSCYSMEISCIDELQGIYQRLLLDVDVVDQNDHTPTINVHGSSGSSTSFSVAENAPAGTFVGQFSVVDGDANAQVMCELSVGSMFGLELTDESNNYQIRTKLVLDREDQSEHLETIQCLDSGSPPRTGTATVTVHVEDKNDQVPVIHVLQRGTSLVPSGAAVSDTVAVVMVHDLDAGDNAQVACWLDDVDFSLVATGASQYAVVTGVDLGLREASEEEAAVTVTCQDSGEWELSSTLRVRLEGLTKSVKEAHTTEPGPAEEAGQVAADTIEDKIDALQNSVDQLLSGQERIMDNLEVLQKDMDYIASP